MNITTPVGYKVAIISNPCSGRYSFNERLQTIERVIEFLEKEEGRQIQVINKGDSKHDPYGVNTKNREEFKQYATDLSKEADIMVAIGGDGTVSDVINSVDDCAIAVIPKGSGNAVRSMLGLPKSDKRVLEKIKYGNSHLYDILGCNGQKAMFMSVGIGAPILERATKYIKQDGRRPLESYIMASIKEIKDYNWFKGEIITDKETIPLSNALHIAATSCSKYYGLRMKVHPNVDPEDGLMDLWIIDNSLPYINMGGFFFGLFTSFLAGNKVGRHITCKEAVIKAAKDMPLQIDGTNEGSVKEIKLNVLPKGVNFWF